MRPATLEGPRVRLRPWRDEDLAPLAALNADPDAMRHFERPLTRAESDAWAGRLRARLHREGWGFWGWTIRAPPPSSALSACCPCRGKAGSPFS